LLNLKLIAIAACVALAGCEQKPVPLEKVMPPPPVKPAKPKNLMLSAGAVGPVTFGIPLAEVEASLGQAMRLDEADNPECSFVSFKALPKVRFMVEKGLITRADVDQEIANTHGIRVGDTVDQFRQKLPDAKAEPHEYVKGGHKFTVPGAGKTAVVMESDGKIITSVRAGLEPSVSYSEGCS
jgi:hypothetical protein